MLLRYINAILYSLQDYHKYRRHEFTNSRNRCGRI